MPNNIDYSKGKIPGEESGIEIRHSVCDICTPGMHCGLDVYVKDGKALLADGTIAASTTNIFAEFRNIISFGVPVRQAVKSCTINPARAIGVDDVTGSIAVGKRADFTVLSSDLKELGCVYIKGKRI